MWQVSCRPGVLVDATPSPREGSGLEMLSLEETLSSLDQMAELPLVDYFICTLQKCRKRKNLMYSKRVHAQIWRGGLEANTAVGNHIVPMFVECGSVSNAQHVFDRLIHPNVHSWTSLILGYIQCGQTQHAFNLYQKMQEDMANPSSHTLMALLKACARLKDTERGQELHTEIARKGFERDIFVGSTLVDMYAKCGSLSESQEVFDKLPVRNVVTWNALMGGFVEHGPGRKVVQCFEQMQLDGASPDAVTFACALKACASMGAITKGQQIHSQIAQKGFENNLLIGSALINMYAKSGSLSEAQQVFDNVPVRDVVLWNTLIAGYAEHGSDREALKCFEQMQLEGTLPNAVTFILALKACGSMGAAGKGQEIHAEIDQKGFGRDLLVGSTVVDMYAKCGLLSEAREVFYKLPARNVVSWSSLIAGYAEHGASQEALEGFGDMQLEGVSPDAITFMHVLKACGSIGATSKGREIHAEIMHKGFEKYIFIGNILVDMYSKCASLSEAQEVFANLPIRDVVSWNPLIAAYAEHGPHPEALKCFEQMELEGISPNALTFACILKACGNMGAIGRGQEIHARIAQEELERDLFVGSNLVDMYVKCGSPSDAHKVFDKLAVRNLVSWSTLIKGYGMKHEVNMAIQCFEDMQGQGLKSDAITFTSLLTACSHTNLVFKGQELLKVMRNEYAIAPSVEHYTSLVDLLGRSGHLNEAEEFLETMVCPPLEGTWTALLGACKTYGEAELGLRCFQQLLEINSDSSASYVLMASIHASAGRWDDAFRIEDLRNIPRAEKKQFVNGEQEAACICDG